MTKRPLKSIVVYMLEKRRTLEFSHRINNWTFLVFVFLWLFLLATCFMAVPPGFVESIYILLLIIGGTLIITSMAIYVMVIIVWVSDLMSSWKILAYNTLKVLLSIVLTLVAAIFKELMIYGI